MLNNVSIYGLQLLLFGCIGCGQDSRNHSVEAKPDNNLGDPVIEIYYKEFLTTSPMRFDEEDLVSVHDKFTEYSEPSSTQKIVKAIDLICEPSSGMTQERMDIRLLIRFVSNGKITRTWKASYFDYYDSSHREVCVLNDEVRDSVLEAIGNKRDGEQTGRG